MLYYDKIDISEGIHPTKSNESKESFVTIGFLTMDSNFKIMYVMIVMM